MTWPQWIEARRIERESVQQPIESQNPPLTLTIAPSVPPRPKRDIKPIVRMEKDPKYIAGGSRKPPMPENEAQITMADALASPQVALWEAARDREIEQLKRYGVFEWVDAVPDGKKVIDTKWVLREKEERNYSDPKRCKARLIARGFTQREGIDYSHTYAPVAREETWRIAISIALANQLIIERADIEGAFLNGLLEEELYI